MNTIYDTLSQRVPFYSQRCFNIFLPRSIHPLPHNLIIHIPNQDMNMLQRPHTLQNSRIFKPLYLRPLHLFSSFIPELSLHEALHYFPPLLRQRTQFIHRQRFLRPHDDVADALGNRIGPVIFDDLVVPRIRERRLVRELELEGAGRGQGLPEEALLQDVLRCAAVLCFDVRGPGEVRFEEGGPALELVELAGADEMLDVLPGVGCELVVGDAELVPVDGRECEGRVVAGEGECCGVGIVFPC